MSVSPVYARYRMNFCWLVSLLLLNYTSLAQLDYPTTDPIKQSVLREVLVLIDGNKNGLIEPDEVIVRKGSWQPFDANRNGRFELDEAVRALAIDSVVIQLTRKQAFLVCVRLDNDKSGDIHFGEMNYNLAFASAVDGYGSTSSHQANLALSKQRPGKPIAIGDLTDDGFLSITELVNALSDGHLVLGSRFMDIRVLMPWKSSITTTGSYLQGVKEMEAAWKNLPSNIPLTEQQQTHYALFTELKDVLVATSNNKLIMYKVLIDQKQRELQFGFFDPMWKDFPARIWDLVTFLITQIPDDQE